MNGYKEIERRLRSWGGRSAIDVQFKGETFRFVKRNSPYVSRRGCQIASGHGFNRVIIFGSVEEDGVSRILFIHAEEKAITEDVISRQIPAHFLPELSFPASYPAWAKNGLVWASYPDTFDGYNADGKPVFTKIPYVEIYGKEVLSRRDLEPFILYKGRDYYVGDIIHDADLNMTDNSDAVQIENFPKGLSIRALSDDMSDDRWEVIKV